MGLSAPTARRLLFAGGIAAIAATAFGAGLWVGRGVRAEAESDRAGPQLPRRGDTGSMFRNRFAQADPFSGTEGVLLTGRARTEECLDGCPFALRAVDGAKGATATRQVVRSLQTALSDLVRASALAHPAFARDLELAVAREQRLSSSEGGTGGPRVLFLSMPRPDLGPDLFAVSVAIYDHADPKFDADAGALPPRGRRISITRIERRRRGEDGAELVAGDVSVHEAVPAGAARRVPEAMKPLLAVRLLEQHFAGTPTLQRGLHLTAEGALVAYGDELSPEPLRKNPELEEALRAVLERP